MMSTRRKRNARGFTLVEALAAAVILGAGAIVVCGLSYRCMVNAARGADYEQGCQLLDEVLDRASAGEFAGLLSTGKAAEGDFAARAPGYRYAVQSRRTDEVGVFEVSARVSWERDGDRYEVDAMTLLGPLLEGERTE